MKRVPRGFTLLEIMVVMIVIAVIVTMAVFMVGDQRGQNLDHEARRLMAVLEMSSQEAILKFVEIGVVFDNQGYQFVSFDDASQEWQEYPAGKAAPLRPYKLPEGMFIELDFDGERSSSSSGSTIETLKLIDDRELIRFEEDEEETEQLTPQIILFSSGELTEFDLYLGYDDMQERPQIRAWQDGTLERLDNF